METDHEIISMAILLPSFDTRRVVVKYKRKYVHEVLVNRLVKLAQEKVFRLTDRPDMTIAVDWDVKHQTNQQQFPVKPSLYHKTRGPSGTRGVITCFIAILNLNVTPVSHKVSVQSKIYFRRCCLKNLMIAALVAILDIGKVQF